MVQDAAAVLKCSLNIGDTAAAQLLSAAGYSLSDVSTALKSIYDDSASDAATALQGIGGVTEDAAKDALNVAGYAASDVEGAFKSVADKGLSWFEGL